MESLVRLNELYKDLTDFSQNELTNIDRLWAELEESIQDFRGLLDKPSRNNESRRKVESDQIKIDGEDFEMNNDFKQAVLEAADALQLNEIEAAKWTLQCEPDSDGTLTSLVSLSVSRFHERREMLLTDLTLLLREAEAREDEDGLRLRIQDIVGDILDIKTGPPSNAFLYTRKCINALAEIEQSMVALGDQTNKAKVMGTEQARVLLEFIESQRISLSYQHELLASVLCHLFRANHANPEDFRKLVDLARKRDRFDSTILHYLPALGAAIIQFGSADGTGTYMDARSLDKMISSPQGPHLQWSLHPFHSAITLMWLAEYSSWYREAGRASPEKISDPVKEAEERNTLMTRSLDDGALEFLLAICGTVRPEDKLDAARGEILELLLGDANRLTLDGDAPSLPFQLLLMETLESFVEALITNLPDEIRKLKVEEDEQRLLKLAELQGGLSQAPQQEVLDARMHLESLLVLMSFAYEHRPEAADHFWGDSDGNLYGFLQWASRRQTVPRVSAFCELLCALAEGDEQALSAHKFLLEESTTSVNRSRKFPSMNYGQMLAELQLYATKVNERSGAKNPNEYRRPDLPELNELESPIMLSCYLRLMAHMCIQSEAARAFFLDTKDYNFVQTLLLLSSGPIPSYLRATIFKALQALLTNKTSAINSDMWVAVDAWASGALQSSTIATKSSQPQESPKDIIRRTFDALSISFDQANASASFIQRLMAPPLDSAGTGSLPFPEDLGSSYRIPGVDPYVDFVIGQLFAKRVAELPDEGQIRTLQFNCLNLIATCLEDFNEKLVAIAHHPSTPGAYTQQSSKVTNYTQRHPCTRVMEWMFNSDVINCLLQAMHQDLSALDSAAPDSPLVRLLERAIDVVVLVLELQPTYLDILRPAAKKSSLQSAPVANSAITAFEDTLVGRSNILPELTVYASTRHEFLALRCFNLIRILASSRRLLSGRKGGRRSAFDILASSPSTRDASLSLLPYLQVDLRELEHGPDATGYRFKDAILTFLKDCLTLTPADPNIAHLFLGFKVVQGSPYLGLPSEDSLTLLHAVIALADDYPDEQEDSLMSWLIHIKCLATEVLRRLFACPPSSACVISELRAVRFLPSQFAKQQVVSAGAVWNGRVLSDPLFWLSDSAIALASFLHYRSFLFEYALTELRSIAHAKLPSMLMQSLSTLMGKSKFEDSTIGHPTVFELFDFANLDLGPDLSSPEVRILADVDLSSCLAESNIDGQNIYDLTAVEELLQLRVTQLQQDGSVRPGEQDDQIRIEIEALMAYLKAQNQRAVAQTAYSQALRMWSKLITVTLESCPMTERDKVQFHLQAFQVVLPRLHAYLVDDSPRALDLATMIDALSASLDKAADALAIDRHENAINDRLSQLFKIMLIGIRNSESSPELREVSYNLCSRYLDRIRGPGPVTTKARASSLEAVKSAGTRLLTVMCDDADVGEGSCRLSALVALNAFVRLSRLEKSTYLIENLVHFNFLEVLIDPIKSLSTDLSEIETSEISNLLRLLEIRLSLLLQISQTKAGARSLLDAGLLTAIRGSLLFQADPDLGIDIDNPESLEKFYTLLAAVLKLLVSTFVSRGIHNANVQSQMRQLLSDHRANIVGMFKKYVGVGRAAAGNPSEELKDIIRSYTVLMSMTEFIDLEETSFQNRATSTAFT